MAAPDGGREAFRNKQLQAPSQGRCKGISTASEIAIFKPELNHSITKAFRQTELAAA